MAASAVVFDNSDKDYQSWLSSNPSGFVLNARRSLVPSYMVLHRASCPSISQYTRMAHAGGFTERGYVKVCATDVSALRAWVRQHGRPDSSFSRKCSHCI